MNAQEKMAAENHPRVALIDEGRLIPGGLRTKILDALDTPDSATGLAERLGVSRQKLNYHIRILESAGLVELEEKRQRRGLEERIMRRTVDLVLVDPTVFAAADLSESDAIGLTATISTAADLIRHAALVARLASERDERVVTATLDTEITIADPKALREMLNELAAVLARHDTPSQGLSVRVAVNVLPGADHQDA